MRALDAAPLHHSRFASWRSSTAPVITIAVLLLALRMLPYLLFEQLAFDSDQAIVGLMAKHLSEGRAFPLFFYGQAYMLGVESWAAVPFFFALGPTVAALRFSILAWNIAFAILLVQGFRRIGLSPWIALVPVLFFVAAPPSMGAMLAWAQGGIIEPFVYVALLWFLRDRPLWFGAVLGVGFLNREFTFYAVPVLIVLQIVTGEFTWMRARAWLGSAVMFTIVWESVEALKPVADLAGPGSRGQLLGGFSGSQVANLVDRFNWQPDALADRVRTMMPDVLAWFIGARQVDSDLPLPDRGWMLWVAVACGILLVVRLVQLVASQPVRRQIARADFAFYMLGVGILATASFIAGKPTVSGYARYVIMGMLVPIGLTSAVLALESRPVVRRVVVAAVAAWAVMAVADHTRVLFRYLGDPPANPAREIADHLRARDVDVAEAEYWQAYRITFLTRERVRVASRDFVRIDEYQTLMRTRGGVVEVSEEPCPGGEPVAGLYLCVPRR
jgi:branched-subunit amino acid transport protein AzlD